jgi:dolichol-phosphate mannosyltransferase
VSPDSAPENSGTPSPYAAPDEPHGVELDQVASHGYCFQVDLAWRAVQAGFRVTEVPITFTEREIGESKMSGGIVREALLKVTVWGAAHRLQQLKGLFGLGRPKATGS